GRRHQHREEQAKDHEVQESQARRLERKKRRFINTQAQALLTLIETHRHARVFSTTQQVAVNVTVNLVIPRQLGKQHLAGVHPTPAIDFLIEHLLKLGLARLKRSNEGTRIGELLAQLLVDRAKSYTVIDVDTALLARTLLFRFAARLFLGYLRLQVLNLVLDAHHIRICFVIAQAQLVQFTLQHGDL